MVEQMRCHRREFRGSKRGERREERYRRRLLLAGVCAAAIICVGYLLLFGGSLF
jgi:hypothetical protein